VVMIQKIAIYARPTPTSVLMLHTLQQAVELRWNMAVAVIVAYQDDRAIIGRGKTSGWRRLIAGLDTVDQIVIADAGDLPCSTVADLLKVLVMLRNHSVALNLLDVETGVLTGDALDIIAAFRRARLSQRIRRGQARALAAGKRIGRPPVPARVKDGIQAALDNGGGVRSTARKFSVSPAFVVNIRRTMTTSSGVS
jgi:DNA invertase Pin-like site-specific DNA recombinase